MPDLFFSKVHNLSMALRKDDPGISTVLKKPLVHRKWHREPEFMTILEEYLSPDDYFFDLGCNIGYVALFVLKNISKNGFLYAIDPDINNIETLKKSINLNKLSNNHLVENLALSSSDGEISFEFSEQSNLHRINKDIKPSNPFYRRIKSSTFDSYFEDKKFPTFIKMDVEGAEIDIIFGMKKFIKSSSKCKIIMELHPTSYDAKRYKEAFDLLFKNGFKIEKFVGASRAHKHPILSKNYKPSNIYKSGPFSRAVYDNLSIEDFHSLNLNEELFAARYNLGYYLRHPKLIFNPIFRSTKLSRAVLLTR